MPDRNVDKVCHADSCEYNSPVHRPHIHVLTANGSYVKFIIEKPKHAEIRSITDADTWG